MPALTRKTGRPSEGARRPWTPRDQHSGESDEAYDRFLFSFFCKKLCEGKNSSEPNLDGIRGNVRAVEEATKTNVTPIEMETGTVVPTRENGRYPEGRGP